MTEESRLLGKAGPALRKHWQYAGGGLPQVLVAVVASGKVCMLLQVL